MNTRIIVALLSLTLAMSINDPAQGDEKNLETPKPLGTRTGEARKEQKSSVSAEQRDGQHDFDFAIGTWKTHPWYHQRPLTGSNTWVEYEGTSVVRKVWNGRANLVELEVDGPAGHIEGLGLRLYNPESRQWSLNFSNSARGHLGASHDRRVQEWTRRVFLPGNT